MKQDVFIFDIDGTLANHEGIRSPFDESKVGLDKPIHPVFKILKMIWGNEDYKAIFVSGRTEGCKNDTILWLLSNLGYTFPTEELALQSFNHWEIELHMRKVGDHRKDSIIKKEIYDEFILPNYNIVGVFDDRMQVCRMLYENGIFCFNVNQGLKEF